MFYREKINGRGERKGKKGRQSYNMNRKTQHAQISMVGLVYEAKEKPGHSELTIEWKERLCFFLVHFHYLIFSNIFHRSQNESFKVNKEEVNEVAVKNISFNGCRH